MRLRDLLEHLRRWERGEEVLDEAEHLLKAYSLIDERGLTPRGHKLLELAERLKGGLSPEGRRELWSLLDQEVESLEDEVVPLWEEGLSMETTLVHGVTPRLDPYNPLNFPIYMTANFTFESAEHAQNTFSKGPKWPAHLMPRDYVYARGATPTTRALELMLAKIESGRDAVVFDSGMGAITSAMLGLTEPGDLLISSSPVYGETYLVLEMVGRRAGLEVKWYDGWSSEEMASMISELKPKLVYLEVPSNPLMKVLDIRLISQSARDVGAIVVVDNTFASPYLQRPLELGADVVVESMTKFISGHSDVLGGALITRDEELAFKVRKMLFVTGGVLDSLRAWLLLRSLKTLHLRVERQCQNARQIAEFLNSHPAVERVFYPGLKEHPSHDVANRQMRDYGSLISFELKGGYEAGMRFINNLRLFKRAVSLGAVESLAEHPASMTHSMIPREERLRMGITDGLVRLSIGIEDVSDLIADLEQALRRAQP